MDIKINATILSDFHGILPKIDSFSELLIIAGDISPFPIQGNIKEMENWLETDFRDWVEKLPIIQVILVPGNHDFIFQNKSIKWRKDFQKSFGGKLIILQHEPCILNIYDKEYKIFGTPYCHQYGNWPFMLPDEQLEEKFKSIPPDLDILITHDPVFSMGDTDVILKPRYQSQAHFSHIGSIPLKMRLLEMYDKGEQLPKYIFCGHIHTGEHELKELIYGNQIVKVANVSLMDEYCDTLKYEPLQVDITK